MPPEFRRKKVKVRRDRRDRRLGESLKRIEGVCYKSTALALLNILEERGPCGCSGVGIEIATLLRLMYSPEGKKKMKEQKRCGDGTEGRAGEHRVVARRRG